MNTNSIVVMAALAVAQTADATAAAASQVGQASVEGLAATVVARARAQFAAHAAIDPDAVDAGIYIPKHFIMGK
jgi:hypothetical protein